MKKIILLITILMLSGCHQFSTEAYDNYGNRILQKCTSYDFILFYFRLWIVKQKLLIAHITKNKIIYKKYFLIKYCKENRVI